jgi:hypothetical protein
MKRATRAEVLKMKIKELAAVVSVKPLDGYRLKLRFGDGARRIVDLKRILWGPMLRPLLKPSEFRKVRVNPEFNCVEWSNGVDLCPDALYDWNSYEHKTPLPEKKSAEFEELMVRYNNAAPGRNRKRILSKIADILKQAKVVQT